MSDRRWAVPAIVFHHVSPYIDYYTNTPPDVFDRQVGWLAELYDFWTARDAYAAFLRGEDPAGKIIVTFDDGYEDNFEFARPVLDAHGVRATFFALPHYAGKPNGWNRKANYTACHMGWEQLWHLAADGHEIGSHAVTHRPLDTLDPGSAEEELVASKRMLEERLGVGIGSFSYPYGRASAQICALAARHYRVAFSTVKSPETDWRIRRYFLRRVYIPVACSRGQIHHVIEGEVRP